MSYATPAHLIARYDVRRLGDLVKDDGTRSTQAQLATDANLQAALDDAAGLIDAACLAGGRYLPTDLTGLSPTGNSFKLLIWINCHLAYGGLVARRGYSAADQQAQAPMYAQALQTLERLRNGELIFADVSAAVESGKPVNVQLDRTVALVSSLDRIFGQLAVDPANPNFRP